MISGPASKRNVLIVVCTVLSACSGHDDAGPGKGGEACPIIPSITHACGQRLTGGGAYIEVVKALTCPLCTVEHPELAIDDNQATFATVTVPVEIDQGFVDGGVTLIAHAQPGASYSEVPGVSFSFGGTSIGGWVFVHTSLGGEPYPAISSAYEADTIQEPTPPESPIYWVGSGETYDAIEVTIGPYRYSNSITPVVGNFVVNIHEFCTSSQVVDVCIPDYLTP